MAGVSTSFEFDYASYGANIGFSQKTKNRMGEFTAKFQAYLDQVKLIAPIELRTNGSTGGEHENYGTSGRNTLLSLSYSQIINQNFQVEFLADGVQQTGYLSLPFHRVYFNDNSVHQEALPDKRFKIPLGVRANYFLGRQSDSESVLPLLYRRLGLEIQYFQPGNTCENFAFCFGKSVLQVLFSDCG
jgi:hypothetical protein